MSAGLMSLFISLGICLVIGVPVAFSIGISCMTLLWIDGGPDLSIVVQRMVGGAKSFNMLAMPMFIFAGSLMVYGTTPRLIKLANMLLRKVPGGLGATAMAACGFFGAVSGSGVASAAAIGKIMGPSMIESGYPKALTAGLIAAGGTMACIIPPSIVMVVYAQASGVSVGNMFLGGVLPGILCIVSLIIMNGFFASKRQKQENKDQHVYTARERVEIIVSALLPLLMPVAILGGVFSGICTATEAAVVAVIYAFILATFVYKELSVNEFVKVAADSVVTTGVIMIIISMATPFGWIMSIQNVPALFATWLLNVTNNPYMIMAFMILLLLLLGTFMETVCIIILVTPILLPIAVSIGMSPLHFGIAMLMALMVGSLTPPLSVNLFTSCRVLNMKIDEAFPDTIYVIATVTVMAVLTFAVPQITELLPCLLGGSV
ncbi:C4-dicarboxylate transporter DctM subunit [Moryella indoligenes]|uniref:C4-dicarboxylate transporter DctM subunit n=1 Tax=Moryella indoligenes TaxID=371674 RepID=A0AAE4ALE9_9FIRM|nr:TRAP transporter large permease [Moryella indoligenes]MDQ0153085.1 C4-dicarboxylate transporter DctM subunit [Moryella indoligenes]